MLVLTALCSLIIDVLLVSRPLNLQNGREPLAVRTKVPLYSPQRYATVYDLLYRLLRTNANAFEIVMELPLILVFSPAGRGGFRRNVTIILSFVLISSTQSPLIY
jgi:hypothetical protein